MGKKISALENWRTKLEEMTGDDETGDTNIDITVIANSDGEAAEDAITADEMSDDAAAADAAEEAQEAAETEAEDLKELAAVIRRHGLNPGMVAVMDALLPTQSLGIYLPAKESLDAHGTNRSYAESVAAALEASSDSFWEKTKNTAKKIWLWIRDFIFKLTSRIGSMVGRIERMGKALGQREWRKRRNEKAKIVTYPAFWTPSNMTPSQAQLAEATGKLIEGMTALSGDLTLKADYSNFANMSVDEFLSKYCGGKDALAMVANVKITTGAKLSDLEWEEDNSKFFDKDDEEATEDIFDKFKETGEICKELLKMCRTSQPRFKQLMEGIDKWKKLADAPLTDGTNLSDDKREAMRAGKSIVDKVSQLTRKAVTNMSKMFSLSCSAYLAGGRVLISCSVPTGSDIKYDK